MVVHRRPFRCAAIALVGLTTYLEVIEWVDLRPLNNVRNGNGQELIDILLALMMTGLAALLLASVRWAAWVSSLILTIWGVLQIQTWWLPYFAGASPAWTRTYAKWFGDNLQVLPSSPGHLAPDVSHLVLHILIPLALAMSVIAALTRAHPKVIPMLPEAGDP